MTRAMRSFPVVCLAVLLPLQVHAATISVPADYATIQAAIDAASDHDTVIVAPGTYNESINFLGKAITLTANELLASPVATVIDGQHRQTTVTFNNGEGRATVIRGFTITHGQTYDHGGGILCDSASPTIERNAITVNEGTGITCRRSSALIQDNVVHGNRKGGIRCDGSSPLIQGNVIAANHAADGEAGSFDYYDWETPAGDGDNGGGIRCEGGSPTIRRNTITGNRAGNGGYGGEASYHYAGWGMDGGNGGCGGAIYLWGSAGVIEANVITDNLPGQFGSGGLGGWWCYDGEWYYGPDGADGLPGDGGGIYVEGGAAPPVLYCDLYNNTGDDVGFTPSGPGNISEDPLFADATGGDYHLKSKGGRWTSGGWVIDTVHSPCIDAGDPDSPFAGRARAQRRARQHGGLWRHGAGLQESLAAGAPRHAHPPSSRRVAG